MNDRGADLERTASIFVQDLIGLQKGERLLIYADEVSDPTVSGAICDCAERIGSEIDFLQLDPDWELPIVLKELTDRIEDGRFDAICELSEQYFYPTAVWARAVQLGGRVYRLGAVNAETFIRCVGQVDQERMYGFGLRLRAVLKRSMSAHVVSKAGTDLSFQLRFGSLSRKVLSKLGLQKRAWVGLPSGFLTTERPSTFLGGQLALLGIPETIQGTAVVDGYLWPPNEIGRLDTPITLTVHKGEVMGITGGSQAKVLNQWLKGKDASIKHFCMGFNPGASPSGTITEAERAFGCLVVGFGTFPFHTDGVIVAPTISLDGRTVEEEGSFVEEELFRLGQELAERFRNHIDLGPA
jgi:hypothetical protein